MFLSFCYSQKYEFYAKEKYEYSWPLVILCRVTHRWWWCRASCPRMSVDILGTNCFTSTETVRLITTESPGLPLRLSHTSWTQRTADELQVVNALVETVLLRPAPWRFSSNTAVMSTKHVPTMFYKKPGTNALVRFSSNRRCIEFLKIWNKNDC